MKTNCIVGLSDFCWRSMAYASQAPLPISNQLQELLCVCVSIVGNLLHLIPRPVYGKLAGHTGRSLWTSDCSTYSHELSRTIITPHMMRKIPIISRPACVVIWRQQNAIFFQNICAYNYRTERAAAELRYILMSSGWVSILNKWYIEPTSRNYYPICANITQIVQLEIKCIVVW